MIRMALIFFAFANPATLLAANALSDQDSTTIAGATTTPSLQVFNAAAPQITQTIDYSTLDFILKSIVIEFGRSDRVALSSRAPTGTRIKTSHSGATALEGNRVYFSRFLPATHVALTQYRQDLEAMGTNTDFSLLSQDQQLAYWYNLHNLAVIEQIALNYPVKLPENIRIGEQHNQLHDAKILTVKGIALSLRDIRTKIVYQNWKDPLVIYGFFHGAIGGPSILPMAYNGDNVRDLLTANAEEFINSLRGVRKFGNKVQVSHIYREAMVYFPDWPTDLRTHLLKYADRVGQGEMDNDYPLVAKNRHKQIADLMNGYTTGRGKNMQVYDSSGIEQQDTRGFPPEIFTLLQGLQRKKQRLIRREKNRFRERIVIVGEDRDADIENETEQTPDE